MKFFLYLSCLLVNKLQVSLSDEDDNQRRLLLVGVHVGNEVVQRPHQVALNLPLHGGNAQHHCRSGTALGDLQGRPDGVRSVGQVRQEVVDGGQLQVQ
uniref:Putative secreted protein n=1 Tax=Ixodes ricinus TaxID=34613 RepID=A0A6B0UE35_IXORI